MDYSLPDWLTPKMTPWQSLAVGAQVGAHIANARYRNQALRVQVDQQAQQDVLRMRELALREQQMTVINQARLNDMEETARVTRDAPKLAQYLKTGELPAPLESQKSYAHLSQIDLSKSRSALGRLTLADEKELNARLLKVSPEARAKVRDMQRDGAPESEIWSYIGVEQRAEESRVAEEKRKMTDYQAANLDLQNRKFETSLEQFDAKHDVELKRLGFTEERLNLDRERLKQGKAFAPSEVKKMYDEATDADMQGKHELANFLRTRLQYFTSQQKQSKTLQAFKLELLPRLRANPDNKKKTNEQLNEIAENLYKLATGGSESEATAQPATATPPTRPTFRFIPDKETLEPVTP